MTDTSKIDRTEVRSEVNGVGNCDSAILADTDSNSENKITDRNHYSTSSWED